MQLYVINNPTSEEVNTGCCKRRFHLTEGVSEQVRLTVHVRRGHVGSYPAVCQTVR